MKKIYIYLFLNLSLFGVCTYNVDLNNNTLHNLGEKSSLDSTVDTGSFLASAKDVMINNKNKFPKYLSPSSKEKVKRSDAILFCNKLTANRIATDGEYSYLSVSASFIIGTNSGIRDDRFRVMKSSDMIYLANQVGFDAVADLGTTNDSQYGKPNEIGFDAGIADTNDYWTMDTLQLYPMSSSDNNMYLSTCNFSTYAASNSTTLEAGYCANKTLYNEKHYVRCVK